MNVTRSAPKAVTNHWNVQQNSCRRPNGELLTPIWWTSPGVSITPFNTSFWTVWDSQSINFTIAQFLAARAMQSIWKKLNLIPYIVPLTKFARSLHQPYPSQTILKANNFSMRSLKKRARIGWNDALRSDHWKTKEETSKQHFLCRCQRNSVVHTINDF